MGCTVSNGAGQSVEESGRSGSFAMVKDETLHPITEHRGTVKLTLDQN